MFFPCTTPRFTPDVELRFKAFQLFSPMELAVWNVAFSICLKMSKLYSTSFHYMVEGKENKKKKEGGKEKRKEKKIFSFVFLLVKLSVTFGSLLMSRGFKENTIFILKCGKEWEKKKVQRNLYVGNSSWEMPDRFQIDRSINKVGKGFFFFT